MRATAVASMVFALVTSHAGVAAVAAEDPREPVESVPAVPEPPAATAPAGPLPPAEGQAPTPSRGSRTWEAIRRDYSSFYSSRGLVRLGAGLAVAGAVANTDADQELFDGYHEEVGTGADSLAEGADHLGDPAVLAGALLGGALLGLVPKGEEERPAAAWVRRTARGYVVGLPAMYYLQQVVGSGRPDEPEGSRWQLFGETHGVSGHAFIAAVPLLTLARTSDNRLVKGAAVIASLATAWARVHEGEHYPSQAFLGWYLAWTATGAVARADAELPERGWALAPVAVPQGAGLMLHASF